MFMCSGSSVEELSLLVGALLGFLFDHPTLVHWEYSQLLVGGLKNRNGPLRPIPGECMGNAFIVVTVEAALVRAQTFVLCFATAAVTMVYS
jgi:hypothetical protein